jgi:hypothetical protein
LFARFHVNGSREEILQLVCNPYLKYSLKFFAGRDRKRARRKTNFPSFHIAVRNNFARSAVDAFFPRLRAACLRARTGRRAGWLTREREGSPCPPGAGR